MRLFLVAALVYAFECLKDNAFTSAVITIAAFINAIYKGGYLP